eukprot:1159763-Pelagomonas_calceolata.AAC.8
MPAAAPKWWVSQAGWCMCWRTSADPQTSAPAETAPQRCWRGRPAGGGGTQRGRAGGTECPKPKGPARK